MNKQKTYSLDSLKWLLISTLLTTATPAFSEYYFGVDATYMDTKTLFGDGTVNFELNPVRIKFGHRYQEFGWEIQALTPSDDTGLFPGLNTPDKFELRGGLGILFTVSTPGRGFYGGIGFTQIVSDYTAFLNGTFVNTTDTGPFTTVNLGAQYPITKNLRVNFDYTFYHGEIDCPYCVPGPSLPAGVVGTDPDVRLSTFGLGLNYSF